MTVTLLILLLLIVIGAFIHQIVGQMRNRGPQAGAVEAEFRTLREGLERQERITREEIGRNRQELGGAVGRFETAVREQLSAQTDATEKRLEAVRLATGERLDAVSRTVEARLGAIQQATDQRLEQIRGIVETKLHESLDKRLGESFRQVSDRLEKVHQGLGEMKSLADGVGDLKRVLTNVKERGTWGEIQLGGLLEQVLTAEQFARNVELPPGSGRRVEFAIRLPGRDLSTPVWLPIDAKFPKEDYERLVEAAARADGPGVEAASKALSDRVTLFAKEIRDKYVCPPHTTDFAMLFLPTEGLYAELLRRPGLADRLQREWRVSLAGPTTLAALLNALALGFRTLAIEQRSSEVWQLLGTVKTEFRKYGASLEEAKKKLEAASVSLGKIDVRNRAIERSLRRVEELPGGQPGLPADDGTEDGDGE